MSIFASRASHSANELSLINHRIVGRGLVWASKRTTTPEIVELDTRGDQRTNSP
jgi:hypothetical protein